MVKNKIIFGSCSRFKRDGQLSAPGLLHYVSYACLPFRDSFFFIIIISTIIIVAIAQHPFQRINVKCVVLKLEL